MKERTSWLIFIKSLLLLINIFSIISPLSEAYNLEHLEGITKNNNTIVQPHQLKACKRQDRKWNRLESA